jgi:lipoyl(octanoyl) transferase
MSWARYLRNLEEVVIQALAHPSIQLSGERLPDVNTGVWVGSNKISAVGLTASRWITMHGCSLNLDCDLTKFSKIVPCGISRSEFGVTSVHNELACNKSSPAPTMASVREIYATCFANVFDCERTSGQPQFLSQLLKKYPLIEDSLPKNLIH